MPVAPFPSDIPICDPHFHIWDNVGNPKNLNLGAIADGPLGVYVSSDYLKGAGELPLRAAVHVETVVGQDGSFDIDTVAETRFVAKDTAAAFGARPVAICGFVHLGRPDAAATLDAHIQAAGPGRFTAVRMILNHSAQDAGLTWPQVAHDGYLKGTDATFTANFPLLAARGLAFDLHCNWFQLADAAAFLQAQLAAGHALPHAVVIDHLGVPKLGAGAADDEKRTAEWKAGMAALAAVSPAVCVKISGLEYIRRNWIDDGASTFDADALATVTAMVHWVVATFGPARCLVASNFPVDLAMSEGKGMPLLYAGLHAILAAATRPDGTPVTKEDLTAMFYGNAVKAYKLGALGAQ